MNSCILMVEIIKDPELRYTSDNQTAIAEMLVEFSPLRSEDPPMTLKAVGWGNLAQEIQSQFHQGDRVILEGRLGMITIDRPEGFKEKRAELTISRIHRVSASDVVVESSLNATPQGNAVTTGSRRPAAKSAPESEMRAESRKPTTVTSPASTAEPDLDDIPF